MDRLEDARKAFKWWESKELPKGINWRTLEHPGMNFAPPYKAHGVPIIYDGNEVPLTPEQEEVASFYAGIPDDGPMLKSADSAKVFQANFFKDFKETLPSGHVIQKFSKCDFSKIRTYLDEQKLLKKAASQDEKAIIKAEKDKIALKFGYCLIDGRMEKMGNYNMEPPGLFQGRGEHPLKGTLKQRCHSESVSINLSINSVVPRVDTPGHAWAKVQHDPASQWLCSWIENVQSQNKYVQLAAASTFKGKSDRDKYTKAITLKKHIGKVRRDYTKKIASGEKDDRQLGVAMWLIDNLALRVGGEKGDDEADTVGCCSLRCEHLTFEGGEFAIELEFLGKDSMLFKQTIYFDKEQYGDMGKKVYRCLKSFCSGKKQSDDVFDTLTPPVLNKHLSSIMSGLTAKVFRTYNASITLERLLPAPEALVGLDNNEKLARYNDANREVAILCNHQKTVSKATETTLENLNGKLETLKDQIGILKQWAEWIKKDKATKIPLKADDKEFVDKLDNAVKTAQARLNSAKSDSEKIEANQALLAAKEAKKNDNKRKLSQKHMYKTEPNLSSVEGRISKWEEDVRKLELDIRNRDDNKEVALGTSKINYMDPRISVAWCKRCEVPIEKIFAKTLRDKFNWAMAVPPTWEFD